MDHVLPGQTFVVLVGPPGVGKTTLAKIIAPRLGLRHWDIDDVREHFFGMPVPNDGTDPAVKAKDDREMAGTYNVLLGVIDGYLRAEHPLLITCTLSSKKWGQDRVQEVYTRYPQARVRVVWCKPEMTQEELRERFKGRADSGYVGATTDPDRAWHLWEVYNPIEIPHWKLDTSPRFTPEESAEEAIRYIVSP